MMRILFLSLFLLGILGAETIEVTIDYGAVRPARTVAVSYSEGATALAVLKQAADVRTKKAGAFTFITAIDGVRSVPQSMGWFYRVDGRSADKTAATYILQGAAAMRWEYRPDRCLMP